MVKFSSLLSVVRLRNMNRLSASTVIGIRASSGTAATIDPMKAVVASKAPLKVDVEAGKAYFWCTCGRSSKQPFCDGSHKVVALRPMKWVAEKSETVYFCNCKQTKNSPRCDGTHKNL